MELFQLLSYFQGDCILENLFLQHLWTVQFLIQLRIYQNLKQNNIKKHFEEVL